MVSLRIESLSKSFKTRVALDKINLDVGESEYVVILGPTGAGKTTLLKTIAGLVKQDKGDISFDGHSVNALAPFERGVAYLPQSYSLFGEMNVRENVAFGPTVQGWEPSRKDQIVREMLDLVHLSGRWDAYPRELSGGMQQRVALARALATQARILLLDEPLRALDARLRVELRRELRNLAEYLGITTLHVTHDQEEAISIADRIVVLRRGKVVQAGSPSEIYEGYEDPFVANFVGEANFLQGKVDRTMEKQTIVVLQDGQLVAGRPSSIPPQVPVIVGVKTDRCDLHLGNAGGENSFPGSISRRFFLGKRTGFEVQTKAGLLKAKVPSDLARKFSEGDEVTLTFRYENAVLYHLPQDGLKSVLEIE